MNDKQKKAYQILVQGLNDIATRKAGLAFTYPTFAKATLEKALAVLNSGDFTLDTDSTAVTPEYNTTKEFVERFIKSADAVSIAEVSEYTDDKGRTKVLYELCVEPVAATADMVDWLDLEGCHFTSSKDGILIYFEIFRTIGTETAFVIEQ